MTTMVKASPPFHRTSYQLSVRTVVDQLFEELEVVSSELADQEKQFLDKE